MFGNNDELIKLLKEIRDIERDAVERHKQERKEDLERIQRWRDEDKQAVAKSLEQQQKNAEAQTRIMQDHLTTFQEKLAVEKALIQAAQPIDKRSIYNEIERDRKAASRANKKNKSEETATNDAI